MFFKKNMNIILIWSQWKRGKEKKKKKSWDEKKREEIR